MPRRLLHRGQIVHIYRIVLSLHPSWRRPFRTALLFWSVCTLLSGHFAEGGGEVIPLTYLASSLMFWLAAFVFALRCPIASTAVVGLVSIARRKAQLL